MSKNKFIKFLKIFAVMFPVFFGFFAKPLALFCYSNGYAQTDYIQDDINNLYMLNLENRSDLEVTNICRDIFMPYFNCIAFTGYSPIPIAYQLTDFTTKTFFGINFDTAITAFEGNPTNFLPICMFLIFIWYIFVELVFFIPEVLLLFIRWCKNLVYSFTQKGGFDV